jgi:hypothetical protein
MKRILLLLFCGMALAFAAPVRGANINVVWTSEVGQFAPSG